MAHIDFSIEDWIAENSDLLQGATLERMETDRADKTHAALPQLIAAIKAAEDVFCGWTVADAEKIRLEEYPNREDLTIEDSYCVMAIVDDRWDAGLGCTWENIRQAYAEYVDLEIITDRQS